MEMETSKDVESDAKYKPILYSRTDPIYGDAAAQQTPHEVSIRNIFCATNLNYMLLVPHKYSITIRKF